MRIRLAFLVVAIALTAPIAGYAQSYYPYSEMYNDYGSWMYQNPQMSWCGSYYGPCQIGTQHVFSPYTYVAAPYVSVGSYQYPMQNYTYPSQQTYSYAYPQYQGNSQPNYQSNYQPTYYQDYGYNSHPTYAESYMSNGEYCYSGYGCYPFYVEDPHQWVYDSWTGTWY